MSDSATTPETADALDEVNLEVNAPMMKQVEPLSHPEILVYDTKTKNIKNAILERGSSSSNT